MDCVLRLDAILENRNKGSKFKKYMFSRKRTFYSSITIRGHLGVILQTIFHQCLVYREGKIGCN